MNQPRTGRCGSLLFVLLAAMPWAAHAGTMPVNFTLSQDALQDLTFAAAPINDTSTMKPMDYPCALNSLTLASGNRGTIVFTPSPSGASITVPYHTVFPVNAPDNAPTQVTPWDAPQQNLAIGGTATPRYGGGDMYFGAPRDVNPPAGLCNNNMVGGVANQTSTLRNYFFSPPTQWTLTPKIGVVLETQANGTSFFNGSASSWTGTLKLTGQYNSNYYNQQSNPGKASYTAPVTMPFASMTYQIVITPISGPRVLAQSPAAGALDTALFSPAGYLQKICLYDGTNDASAPGSLTMTVTDDAANNSGTDFAMARNGNMGDSASNLLYYSLTGVSAINSGAIARNHPYTYATHQAQASTYDSSIGGNTNGLPTGFSCVRWDVQLKAARQGKQPGTYRGKLRLNLQANP